MIYLVTALEAEARPLIDHYRLKRDFSLPYTLYRNDDRVLIVTQMGSKNAMMSLSALLGWRRPQEDDILLNIGICGAPEAFPIGEPLLIHQITDHGRHYYPDILYPHSLTESPLKCIDTPQDSRMEIPVDMESAGIFQAASRFFKLHRIAFVKIVSDHFRPDTVTKQGVNELIRNRIDTIESVIRKLSEVYTTPPLFSSEEREKIERLKTFFTKSQGDLLEDALSYFRLKSPGRTLNLSYEPLPDSKRERSLLHERIIAELTA